MELSQLRYFCDVAQTENMTRSAKRLHVVQSALSQSVRRLESELGVALFERSGRNIRLTEEGRVFRDRIEPLLAGVDNAAREVSSARDLRKRTIRIGLYSASNIVTDAIVEYAREHPDAAFEVTQDVSDEHCAIRVDTSMVGRAAMRLSGAGAQAEPARSTEFNEAIGIAVPTSGFAADVAELSMFEDAPFISLAGSRRFREVTDELCEAYGFVPRFSFVSDNPDVVKKLIGLGLGVGFWSEHSWGSLEGSGARWVPLAEEGFVRTIVVQLVAGVEEDGPAADFYEYLVEYCAAVLPNGGANA